MASMIAVVPLGLLKMQAFQCWTRSHQLCAKRHLRQKLAINPSCMSALLPWQDPALMSQGANTEMVSMDASPRGWETLCNDMAVRGVWTTAQRQLHISHLDMLSAFVALKHFCQASPSCSDQDRQHNTAYVYINPFTSPAESVPHSVAMLQCTFSVYQSHPCSRSQLVIDSLQDIQGVHIYGIYVCLAILTFLLRGKRHMWTLGLFLNVKIHIVLLHVKVDGSSWVTVHYRLETADRRPFARPCRVWMER